VLTVHDLLPHTLLVCTTLYRRGFTASLLTDRNGRCDRARELQRLAEGWKEQRRGEAEDGGVERNSTQAWLDSER
jgi:hypothetical protein